jgi:bifunctional DNase/RNase
MSLVRLNIKGISYSQTQSGAYALILSEENGQRKLPIVIGAFEAQSIAIALEKDIRPPRPLTHDLFKNFSDRFDISIKQVIIHKLVDGVFYSSLVCERDNEEEVIDARTSDAIALALRFSAPIFTYKTILEKAGIVLKVEPEEENSERKTDENQALKNITRSDTLIPSDTQSSFKNLTTKELNTMLQQAVANEDYETAAKLRDEISKRQ